MWWMVLASLLFPGFGQALVHRTMRAIAWAVAAIATLFGIAWSVWLWPVALLVQFPFPSWATRADEVAALSTSSSNGKGAFSRSDARLDI